jgi:hypothetical protein
LWIGGGAMLGSILQADMLYNSHFLEMIF